jgi:hypothetical protein
MNKPNYHSHESKKLNFSLFSGTGKLSLSRDMQANRQNPTRKATKSTAIKNAIGSFLVN